MKHFLKNNSIRFLVFIPLLTLLMACNEKETRSYSEKTAKPALESHMAQTSTNEKEGRKLEYQKPEGWQEGSASGMRLANFSFGQGELKGACTIISLAGEAGGLKANVVRWIEQTGEKLPVDTDLDRFLDRLPETGTGLGKPAKLVDLTDFPTAGGAGERFIVAVINLGQDSLFLKMSGPASLLKKEKAAFTNLCQSLKLGG
jgi:hypothetical protein